MTADDHTPADATSFARAISLAALLGAAGAVAALAFVAVVAAGQGLLWPDQLDPNAFSGSIKILVAMTAGGLAVGAIHTVAPLGAEQNVFVALATGQIDAKAVPGGVAIATVSLIAGFSLGPEVPTGMAAAGLASYAISRGLIRRRDADVAISAAISGAWGGLFTAPFTALLLNLELTVERRTLRWVRITADATAAIVGFSIFFAIDAGWSDVLQLLELPTFDFSVPELALAAGFGVLGAIIGTVFKLSMVITRKLAAPLSNRPILRCTALGLLLGLVGMALPLTLFLGTDGLVDVTTDPAALGAGLILVSALVKILVTTSALSFGFVGGPIFPLLFIGGSFGTVIHLAFDGIPLALAVVAMMAAVPSSVIPVPLSIATLTALIAGIPASEGASIFVAAIVAMIAGRLIESMLPKPAEATAEE